MPSVLQRAATHHRSAGFTLVEVMMASTILVVAFIGTISAITIGTEMMATAQRQTVAAQIINHELEKHRLEPWSTVSALTAYAATDYTTLTPDDTQFDNAISASGVTFSISRAVTTVTTSLVEVTYTVTWTKSGTTTAAGTPTGSWLNQLTFFTRQSPISRTYTRKGTGYYGRYGLSMAYQRS